MLRLVQLVLCPHVDKVKLVFCPALHVNVLGGGLGDLGGCGSLGVTGLVCQLALPLVLPPLVLQRVSSYLKCSI